MNKLMPNEIEQRGIQATFDEKIILRIMSDLVMKHGIPKAGRIAQLGLKMVEPLRLKRNEDIALEVIEFLSSILQYAREADKGAKSAITQKPTDSL